MILGARTIGLGGSRPPRYSPHMSSTERPRDSLLQRVAQGDAEAVGACLERYGPLVWSIARSLSSDVGQVEDAVQEIFIELWRKADRYDSSKAAESTFIATIARRRIIDRRRSRARQPESEDLENHDTPVEDRSLHLVELGDDAARAAEAVATLKPDQQRVIQLSVIEGLTHQEIAATTGLPLGTVKSHIRRGLDRVAQILRGREDEGGSR